MIYFIKSESGHVKIGFTDNNIESRIAALQTANPFKLTLLKTIVGDAEKERRLHFKFKKYRCQGEWFILNKTILKYIESPHRVTIKKYKSRKDKGVLIDKFNLSKTDRDALAKRIGRHPEHLAKIARGERPCPAKLALLIDQDTGGLIRKEQLVGWE